MFRAAGWKCVRCGRPGRLELHHVKPVESGGAVYEPSNVEVLCRTCHILHHRNDRADPARAEWRSLVADA